MKVVKEYCLSKDYFRHKDDYASYYSKYSFYHARGFLESRLPNEYFSELIFADVTSIIPIDDAKLLLSKIQQLKFLSEVLTRKL